MELIQAIILGIVQGLTEFMPISSSAHLIIVPWAFGWPDFGLSFDLVLHLGTLLAVLVYFRADWVRYIRALFSGLPNFSATTNVGLTDGTTAPVSDDLAADRRIAWMLLIATIPGAIFGIIGESKIDDAFHDSTNLHNWGIYVLAIVMIVLALVLALAERLHRGVGKGIRQITLLDSVIIGVAQAFAIIPGVSRSGSTITAGLFRNLERATAARFSFLLATPLILGAGAKSVYDLIKDPATANPQNLSVVSLIAGFIAAAIVGYATIRFLLGYLQRHNTNIFIGYRIVLGVVLIIVAVLGLR